MSLRAIATRLLRHGQCYFRHAGVPKRDIHTANISERVNAARQVQQQAQQAQLVPRSFALRSVGLQVGLHARRILVDSVLNRVTSSLAAKLRKEAAKRMLFGDSGHFFALVGVSLASGTGILTKEEELEGVCWEIREAISKIKWSYQDSEVVVNSQEPLGVKDLEFGAPLGKGANAVVYTARLHEDDVIAQSESDITTLTEASILPQGVQGTFGNVQTVQTIQTQPKIDEKEVDYPLAVKMMFNYDIQSNGMAILRAMYKETIPARVYYSNVGITDWELALSNGKKHLPPHPNIVAMYSVFTDFIPELRNATDLYPAALPQRIYPEGEGRNMSLFLIMKKYECSLQEYLSSSTSSLTTRQSILLFTQLLEGVAHLSAHGIAHRDLKADNLLLDTFEENAPILVISDFGCCLAERNQHLTVSYNSFEVDKGGNTALMAPEIINQTPGTFSLLNYNKSDLWAAATIAYEIFGQDNPFYDGPKGKLKASNYKEEELPVLGKEDDVPDIFQALVANLLKRNPSRRLDAEVAANVCQLFLWAPSAWLKPMVKLPTSNEILQWLLCLTTKVLCEGRLSNPQMNLPEESKEHAAGDSKPRYERGTSTNSNYCNKGRRTYTEYLLISSFLVRAKLANVKAALQWIQNNVY